MIEQQKIAIENCEQINTPTLMLLGDKDQIVDNKVSEQAFERIATKDKKIITYPNYDHFYIKFDGEYQRMKLDVLDFIKQRIV